MSAHVTIILVGGEVEYVTEGDVAVEVLDYDNDPELAERAEAGLRRLKRDAEVD